MSLIPTPLTPYLGVAKAVGAAIVLVAAYGYGRHSGTASERVKWEAQVSQARQARIDEYEKKLADAAEDKAKSEQESAALAAKSAASEKAYQALLDRIPKEPLVIHEPAKPGETCPPASRLAPSFRMRFNEAVTGTSPGG
jgi:hypothetical protein